MIKKDANALDEVAQLDLLRGILKLRCFSAEALAEHTKRSLNTVESWLQSDAKSLVRHNSQKCVGGRGCWELCSEARVVVRTKIRNLAAAALQSTEIPDDGRRFLRAAAVAEAYAEDLVFTIDAATRAGLEKSAENWLAAANFAIKRQIEAGITIEVATETRLQRIRQLLQQPSLDVSMKDWHPEEFEQWFLEPQPENARRPPKYRRDAFDSDGWPNPRRKIAQLLPPTLLTLQPGLKYAALAGLLAALATATAAASSRIVIKRQLYALSSEIKEQQFEETMNYFMGPNVFDQPRVHIMLPFSLRLLFGFALQSIARLPYHHSDEVSDNKAPGSFAANWLSKLREEATNWHPAYALVYLRLRQNFENPAALYSEIGTDLKAALQTDSIREMPAAAPLLAQAKRWDALLADIFVNEHVLKMKLDAAKKSSDGRSHVPKSEAIMRIQCYQRLLVVA